VRPNVFAMATPDTLIKRLNIQEGKKLLWHKT